MKTVRDVMTADIIGLQPSDTVETAIARIRSHHIGGLPVLDENRLVGLIAYEDVLGMPIDTPVERIMDTHPPTVSPDTTVSDAAERMISAHSGRLLVMDGDCMVGIVTASDVMTELRRSLDPLTGLPRADALRDWGLAVLKRGEEITILFIDLDDFGQFNKKHGHVVGDSALKHVAQVLQDNVDPQRDLLCRYAGDEFVIATTRSARESVELAAHLDEALGMARNPKLPEPVTVSIGVHGGKRIRQRADAHHMSVLDNLINLASKSSTLAKERGVAIVCSDTEQQTHI